VQGTAAEFVTAKLAEPRNAIAAPGRSPAIWSSPTSRMARAAAPTCDTLSRWAWPSRGPRPAQPSAYLATAARQNISASGMLRSERIDRGGDPRGIETFVSLGSGLCHNIVHHLPRYRTALTLSRTLQRQAITPGGVPLA